MHQRPRQQTCARQIITARTAPCQAVVRTKLHAMQKRLLLAAMLCAKQTSVLAHLLGQCILCINSITYFQTQHVELACLPPGAAGIAGFQVCFCVCDGLGWRWLRLSCDMRWRYDGQVAAEPWPLRPVCLLLCSIRLCLCACTFARLLRELGCSVQQQLQPFLLLFVVLLGAVPATCVP